MTVTNISQEILDWYNVNDIGVEADTVDSEVWGEFYESLHTKAHTETYDWAKTAVLPSGPAYIVQDVGGGEGDGEERYVVFQAGDQFFQVDGYYESWDGTTWENTTPYEVKPTEVTVIQYVRA